MAYRAHFVATGTLSRFATGTLPFAAEGKASAVIGRIEFPDRSRLSYWMQAEVRRNPQLPVFLRIMYPVAAYLTLCTGVW